MVVTRGLLRKSVCLPSTFSDSQVTRLTFNLCVLPDFLSHFPYISTLNTAHVQSVSVTTKVGVFKLLWDGLNWKLMNSAKWRMIVSQHEGEQTYN